MKQKYNNMRKSGFTLIELMITIAIVGILALIAMVSYQNYVIRAHRIEGLSTMQSNMLAIEQFRTRQLRYPTVIEITDGSVTGYKKSSDDSGVSQGYDISYAIDINGIVTLSMTPNKLLFNGETMCRNVTLNSNELQTATNDKKADTTNDCWNNK